MNRCEIANLSVNDKCQGLSGPSQAYDGNRLKGSDGEFVIFVSVLTTRPDITRAGVSNSSGQIATSVSNGRRREAYSV